MFFINFTMKYKAIKIELIASLNKESQCILKLKGKFATSIFDKEMNSPQTFRNTKVSFNWTNEKCDDRPSLPRMLPLAFNSPLTVNWWGSQQPNIFSSPFKKDPPIYFTYQSFKAIEIVFVSDLTWGPATEIGSPLYSTKAQLLKCFLFQI